jgi:hypothetical protein
MPSDRQTESRPENKALLDQLSSEYKILQDKIDKIGAFKFTIRGWSVTIVVASCIGATTARLPSPFFLLGLIIFVAVFGHMERIQTGHREVFGRRCAEIERWIWRLLREQGAHAPSMVPKIAHELADEMRSSLRRWKSPHIRRLVRALKSHDEYVFCAVLIISILALTWWLASHPKSPDRPEPFEVIQHNGTRRETGASVPLSQRDRDPKETEQNASKKKTFSKKD